MLKISYLQILAALLITTAVDGSCPGGWIHYIDSLGEWCFLISAELKTWHEAAAECQSWNSHLAKINSDIEVLFLRATIDRTPHITSPRFWLGGKDSAYWNRFEWTSSGSFVDQGFTYWWPGEPNNLGNSERCLEMRHGPFYKDTWNDTDCYLPAHFICKSSAVDKPRPYSGQSGASIINYGTIGTNNGNIQNNYQPNIIG